MSRVAFANWSAVAVSWLGTVPPGLPSESQDAPRPISECATTRPGWIFCDDFEEDRLSRYFEYDKSNGHFVRAPNVGVDGSYGMRARWHARGVVSVGSLHLAFGRTPTPYIRPVDDGQATYREIYWRLYLSTEPGWIGGGADKLSRAQILSTPKWAQAMVALVWSGNRAGNRQRLLIEPASGTDNSGRLRTSRYNDSKSYRWLGSRTGRTEVFSDGTGGRWYCIEAHVKLNDPGQTNGVFELWIDGRIEAERRDLNWVGSYDEFGINTIFVENYWNAGAVKAQERFIDRLVVSTAPIGCD